MVQKGGSLIETDETAAGGAAGGAGRTAWRATAMAWTSPASRAFVAKRTRREARSVAGL